MRRNTNFGGEDVTGSEAEGDDVALSAGATRTGRRRRSRLTFLVAVELVAFVIVAVLIVSGQTFSLAPKAALVDQLGLTFPNPGFVEGATGILREAGYTVDYFYGKQVTVDLYRRLPGMGYKVVILRVHSPRLQGQDGQLGDDVVLLTGETRTSATNVDQQDAKLLAEVIALSGEEASEPMFGITDGFVRSRMVGSFEGATVILMGCSGLRSRLMGEAFVAKGARAVVGWDNDVSSAHTDAATTLLLRQLLIDKLPVKAAVTRTMDEKGADPFYGGRLVSYPF